MNKKNKIENLCNHPNCMEEGVYKAPLGYDNLSNYQWFCIEHIKEFNKLSLIHISEPTRPY